jgi:hypothetical protein
MCVNAEHSSLSCMKRTLFYVSKAFFFSFLNMNKENFSDKLRRTLFELKRSLIWIITEQRLAVKYRIILQGFYIQGVRGQIGIERNSCHFLTTRPILMQIFYRLFKIYSSLRKCGRKVLLNS